MDYVAAPTLAAVLKPGEAVSLGLAGYQAVLDGGAACVPVLGVVV